MAEATLYHSGTGGAATLYRRGNGNGRATLYSRGNYSKATLYSRGTGYGPATLYSTGRPAPKNARTLYNWKTRQAKPQIKRTPPPITRKQPGRVYTDKAIQAMMQQPHRAPAQTRAAAAQSMVFKSPEHTAPVVEKTQENSVQAQKEQSLSEQRKAMRAKAIQKQRSQSREQERER